MFSPGVHESKGERHEINSLEIIATSCDLKFSLVGNFHLKKTEIDIKYYVEGFVNYVI